MRSVAHQAAVVALRRYVAAVCATPPDCALDTRPKVLAVVLPDLSVVAVASVVHEAWILARRVAGCAVADNKHQEKQLQ